VVTFMVSGFSTLLGQAVGALLRQHLPESCVEADLRAPGDHFGIRIGLEGCERWIYVTGSTGPDRSAMEALASGACGVLSLDSRKEEIALALGALIDGTVGFVPVSVVQLMAQEGMAPRPTPVGLTSRELQILHLVARGLSNGEVAANLMISTNTVRTHLHALSVKLEATSRTRMLANARALSIPEAFASADDGASRTVPA
jgi:two-component system, NarL family, response regulator LiaR